MLYEVITMRDKGFTVIAAAAFVAEHSFSSASHPIASGRPDAADLRTAQEYGQKLAQLCAVRPLMTPVLSLTGNVPYRERPPSSRITPVTVITSYSIHYTKLYDIWAPG